MMIEQALGMTREEVDARICPGGENLVLTVHPWHLKNGEWVNGLDFAAYPYLDKYRVSAGSISVTVPDKSGARQLLVDAWFSYWAAFQSRVDQAMKS